MFDISQFEGDAYQDEGSYWRAHDFMVRLGYESWASFKGVVQKAQASCLQLGIDIDGVFKNVTLKDGTKSYGLTRFACFLIAMQADTKKPQVIAAQVALAAIAEELLKEKISESDLARIEERGKLTLAEKHLSGVAKSAGLSQGVEFAVFKDAGFRGMYDMSLKELRDYKGRRPN